ncbi:hypothetical protein [Campylobacter geochelonis]|uniref:hypothetical protein n=1 Tax=Campylobacter geochelonis TaxID=1780362 RepID=UPI0007709D81|nr:hypothetical protein [Campylobacter geochelonis]CZE48323.1 Uncharacterised protein [Campylobacter geochelonis]CZE50078.1 Uncharacterised protein [Campylobacter geochelonis]
MTSDKLTKALIYESQGLINDALEIYKEILKIEPTNKDALVSMQRLINLNDIKIDKDMLKLFLSDKKEDIEKFKRWLVEI